MTRTTFALSTVMTRDRLHDVSRELGTTYDETLERALAALQRERRRAQMRAESRQLLDDEADREEERRVLRKMESLSRG